MPCFELVELGTTPQSNQYNNEVSVYVVMTLSQNLSIVLSLQRLLLRLDILDRKLQHVVLSPFLRTVEMALHGKNGVWTLCGSRAFLAVLDLILSRG